ncbi:MAG: CoA transferase [Alphaproteobacteria bacterium]|nr:CoA transferase [Alphaproteobacteria bacterium]MCW5739305.1 CoA transferase [Alphaproteobacteria bacterium]
MFAPLQGVRVVDLTHVLAGPYVTHVLTQLGADVVKIERPGVGDVMRNGRPGQSPPGLAAGFVGMNHGKRSLTLDLKDARGQQVLTRLVERADVLVENQRPGELDRLGFGYATAATLNARLVYASISGWGQSGPIAGRTGYDQVIQAATGMMMMQGETGTPPLKTGFPAIDIATGMNGACAIMAALLERQRNGGKGCHIDIAMSDSALMLMFGPTSAWLVGGLPNERMGNRSLASSPTSGVFETGDGWISVAANTVEQGRKALDVVGRPELKSDPRFAPARQSGFFFVADLDGAEAEFVRALKAKDAEHWERAFNAAGIACAKVRSISEFLAGPYRFMPGIHRTIADQPGYDRPVEAPGAGFRVDGTVPAATRPASPLGGDSAAVLAELGFTAAEIEAMAKDGVT